MTIFGIIWLTICFAFFVLPDIRYLTTLTILGMVLQSDNVITFIGNGVGAQIITSAIFIIRVLIEFRASIRISVKSAILFVPMIGFFLVALYSSWINNSLEARFLHLMQLLIYILAFYAMYIASRKLDRTSVYRMMKGVAIFCVVIGFVQLLITSNLIPRLDVVTELFFNDKSKVVYYHLDNYFRVTSTFMEPSYYAGFAVGMMFYFITFEEKLKSNLWLIILLGIQIILTFSTTAYAITLIVGVLYLAFIKGGKRKIIILLLGITAFLILYFLFYDVLDKVVFSKAESGSGITRYYWDQAALKEFNKSPVYGIGYKNVRGSSIFYSLLGELGILGVTAFFVVMASVLVLLVQTIGTKTRDAGLLGALLGVSGVLAAQLIACPDFDLCTLWIWYYLLALHIGTAPELERLYTKKSRLRFRLAHD
ncbi:MAG: hypothetical protein IJ598_10150 [Ruminococcus sp.]|nr:hypothetical protein [Ruminococcus sp.]